MKLAMFTSAEAYADWNRREAEAIRNNGLKMVREELDKALNDKDAKYKWFSMNMMFRSDVTDEDREREWERHINWLKSYIRSLERKIRKLERDADKALANA